MAAALPNPSIVFVPLDVLTADELNQICQNVSFLAELFPVSSANIGNNAVTGAKIALNTITSDKLNNATSGNTAVAPTNKNVMRLGNRKVMWGTTTVNAVESYNDKTQDVSFPENFATVPIVLVSVAGWYGIVYAQVDTSGGATTVSKFKLVVRQDFGITLDIKVNYIAIG